MNDGVRAFLSDRRVLVLAVALAILLPALNLDFGFAGDDWYLLPRIEGLDIPHFEAPDLYTFSGSTDEETLRFVRGGPLPWWTDPGFRLRFFRPLTQALFALDSVLFGRNPIGWHLHSIAWNALLVGAAGLVLRRALPGAVGGIALLLFAIDESRVLPTVWLCNRHGPIAAACGAAAIALHVGGSRTGRIFAPLALAGALAAGETGLQAVVFLGAYELFGGRRRVRALLPYVVVCGVWAGIYVSGGYGARRSSTYIDPLHHAGTFLAGAPVKLAGAFGALFLGVPSDLAGYGPKAALAVATAGGIGLVLAGLLIGRLGPFPPHARWLVVGSVAALVPGLASFPTDRGLLLAGMGGAAVIAVLLDGALRMRWRLVATAIVALHGVLALAGWVGTPALIRGVEAAIREAAASPDLADTAGKKVLVLQGGFAASVYPFDLRVATGEALPETWWPLAWGHDLEVTRAGARELDVRVDGELVHGQLERLYRAPDTTFSPGDTVGLDGVTVVVTEVGPEGGPSRLTLRFDSPPDADPYVLLAWDGEHLARTPPPPVGGSLRVPWYPDPLGL